MQLLAYGRGIDTTRMREVLGFEPAYTTREAFEDFAAHVVRPVQRAALLAGATMTTTQAVVGAATSTVRRRLGLRGSEA